jgi:hypothetical protein
MEYYGNLILIVFGLLWVAIMFSNLKRNVDLECLSKVLMIWFLSISAIWTVFYLLNTLLNTILPSTPALK